VRYTIYFSSKSIFKKHFRAKSKANQGLQLRVDGEFFCVQLDPVEVVRGDPGEDRVVASLATFRHRSEADQLLFSSVPDRQRTTAITLKNKLKAKFEKG
jgi:hypothetical protein